MCENKKIGREFKIIANLINRNFEKTAVGNRLADMTGTHGWIIKYLYDHRDHDVFQKDIETDFSIRRSTVTGILQLMERNGLIVRESVANDARLKKLVLTDKAIQLHRSVEETIVEYEEKICQGITEQEKEIFFQITEKIRQNLT